MGTVQPVIAMLRDAANFVRGRRHFQRPPVPGLVMAAISFIIPAYNEERLLGRTLEAIAGAAHALSEATEVIVVDDASMIARPPSPRRMRHALSP
jgi:cellulose synthase/poly-beta-1,6-N-acetylglucosamine synthase-like glycosyltransferase